jgi:hypothetical protein
MVAVARPELRKSGNRPMSKKLRGSATADCSVEAQARGEHALLKHRLELLAASHCPESPNGTLRGTVSFCAKFGCAIKAFRVAERVAEGVLISLRGSRRRSAVHPASAGRHRRRPARVPAPRSGSAARGEVHGQLAAMNYPGPASGCDLYRRYPSSHSQ